MNIILFDDTGRKKFLPLVFTRPVGNLRIGILTIDEKYRQLTKMPVSFLTEEYLQQKFPLHISNVNYLVNSRLLPVNEFIDELQHLNPGEKLIANNQILAACISKEMITNTLSELNNNNKINRLNFINYLDLSPKRCKYNYTLLENIRSVFLLNGKALNEDFKQLTHRRDSLNIR